MNFNEIMNKIRQWDNRSAQWIIRHFYILFFEVILVAIFVGVFANSLKIIDISADINKTNVIERLLMAQSVNTLLITILLLFNSFWMLYIFSSLLKIRSSLKNVDFNLSRRERDQRNRND